MRLHITCECMFMTIHFWRVVIHQCYFSRVGVYERVDKCTLSKCPVISHTIVYKTFNIGEDNMATAIYMRVSTEKQEEHGVSLETQKERLQSYCIMKDLKNTKEYVDV